MVQKTAAHAEELQKIVAEPSDVGTFGRFVETPVKEMSAEMKSVYDYMLDVRGMVPGPHKIYLSKPKLLRAVAQIGAHFQTESTLTRAEIEIVTNVINGRWGAAYTNHEHEKISIVVAHLPAEKVSALIAGLPTSFEDPREQIVYELSLSLAGGRVVPVGLLRRAQALVGDAGIVDVTVLMGWFTAACFTLMVYDVPSNAVGLDQTEQKQEH